MDLLILRLLDDISFDDIWHQIAQNMHCLGPRSPNNEIWRAIKEIYLMRSININWWAIVDSSLEEATI